jgi:two-component system, OmpR family, KDP operon response regulator KdpE
MNRNKILIVDDDKVVAKTLTMKLEPKGFEVISAADGAQAASIVRSHKPDLILLDVSFPPDPTNVAAVPWDAFTIIQWIRRIENGKDIPIIVVSGCDPKKYKDRCMEAGAIGYFQKPVNVDELLKTIQAALGQPAEASAV